MASWFRRRRPVDVPTPRKSLTAAAASLSDAKIGMSAWKARQGEDEWQKIAWNYYDSIGELNAALRWIGNAVSLADLYAAEIDEETGTISEATDNAVVQAVANTILGGPIKRAQAQQTITLNWLVGGEVFLLIRPTRGTDQPDEWFVLSSTEVMERGGIFRYCDPITGQMTELSANDQLIRVWNPHPRSQSHADSSVRSAIPILREVERASMNIMSRLDSRLAGAGVWLVPEEMDFPATDNEPGDAQTFTDMLRRAAEASLRNPGEASAQVPIILPAPGQMITDNQFQHLTFSTELTGEVTELRNTGIRRLAMALDIPAEIMTGMGESSHWNAWQIEETTYKIHVAPLLEKLGDALTGTYLQPILRMLGVANPEQYVITFNTAEIVSRPNQFDELNTLFDKGLITDDYMRSELGIPDGAVPSEEDTLKRLAITMVTNAPTLVESLPQLVEIIGFDAPEPAPAPSQPALPAPSTNVDNGSQTSDGSPPRPSQSDEGLVAAAELIVWDALSRAGGRMLTRQYRGQYNHIPKHDLHTVIPQTVDVSQLLEGSFQFVDAVAPQLGVQPQTLESQLRGYCTALISQKKPHDREGLRKWLSL